MAIVRLHIRECDDGGLPDVCVQCGERATVFKEKQFAWYPKWILVLLLAGAIPFAIAASLMTWRRMVTVPLCADHRYHWLKSQLLILATVLGTVVLSVALFVGAAILDPKGDTLGPVAVVMTLMLVIAMIVILVVLANMQIVPTEVTDHYITLKNVCPAFVDALEEFREEGTRAFDIDRDVGDRWRDRDRRPRPARDDRRGRGEDRERYRPRRDPEDDDQDRDPPRRPRDRYRDDD